MFLTPHLPLPLLVNRCRVCQLLKVKQNGHTEINCRSMYCTRPCHGGAFGETQGGTRASLQKEWGSLRAIGSWDEAGVQEWRAVRDAS